MSLVVQIYVNGIQIKKKFPEFHCFCKVILIGWVLAICICTFDGNYVCTQHRGLNQISLGTNIVVRNAMVVVYKKWNVLLLILLKVVSHFKQDNIFVFSPCAWHFRNTCCIGEYSCKKPFNCLENFLDKIVKTLFLVLVSQVYYYCNGDYIALRQC